MYWHVRSYGGQPNSEYGRCFGVGSLDTEAFFHSHLSPVHKTISNNDEDSKKKYSLISIRKFPDSNMREFGQWIAREEFEDLNINNAASKNVEAFEDSPQVSLQE